MTCYKFALIVSGTVDAPTEAHARQQVKMGLSLSARLISGPALEIALTTQEVSDAAAEDVRATPVPLGGKAEPSWRNPPPTKDPGEGRGAGNGSG